MVLIILLLALGTLTWAVHPGPYYPPVGRPGEQVVLDAVWETNP